jgi:transaldolase
VTTNPTIFASALSKGHRYGGQLRDQAELSASTDTAIFAVTTDDVRAACDVLAPVCQQTAGRDGRVSIEVDPRLARDAAATADMARALRTTTKPGAYSPSSRPSVSTSMTSPLSLNATA